MSLNLPRTHIIRIITTIEAVDMDVVDATITAEEDEEGTMNVFKRTLIFQRFNVSAVIRMGITHQPALIDF